MSRYSRVKTVGWLIPLLLISLAGCGKKGEESTVVQPAAKVDGVVIGSNLVQHEVKKLGDIPADKNAEIANQMLGSLIDQEFLVREAIKSKLDARPEVAAQLEEARRKILADVYLDEMTKSVGKPAEAEIKAYYDSHPELFAQRRVYNLQELNLQVPQEWMAETRARLKDWKGLPSFGMWIQERKIPVRARQIMKSSEQLPMDLLGRLRDVKPGEIITQEDGNTIVVIIPVAVEGRPVTVEQATPMIERYLVNARKRDMAEAFIKEQRQKAKIEYSEPYKAISQPDKVSDTQSGKDAVGAK